MFTHFPASASIVVTTPPTKTTYVEGESFDPTGMVVEMIVDGQSEQVYDYTYSPSGALTTSDNTITISYQGMTATVSITVEEGSLQNQIRIVNNSSDTVEIYYEEDKSEYGNTFISGGSTQTITIDSQYPYYLRYDNGGSTNTHTFNGTYQGNSYSGNIGYYDGNIQPPEAVGSATEWNFYNNDGGTLTISGSQSGNRITINNNASENLDIYLDDGKDREFIANISTGTSYNLSDFETEEGLDYVFTFSRHVNETARFTGTYQGSSYSNASCDIDGSNNIWDPTTYDYRWHFEDGDNGTLTIDGQQSGNLVTYDGENQVGYGENAENPIEY